MVYRHRVLPEDWRGGLPDIEHSWGNFGHDVGGGGQVPATTVPTTPTGGPDPMARMKQVPATDGGRVGQAGALLRQVDLIGAEPSINMIHVQLPHHPYDLTPWGGVDADTWIPSSVPRTASDPGYEFIFRELRALQAMQVGAVDGMIGHLIAHLKDTGAWDDGTVVVTSDHGVDITPPGFTRTPSKDNIDELFRIPLFIKAPGQTAGEVRDDPASTVDVLPSVVDLLGIDADWTFEGHSLFDGTEPKIDRLVTSDVQAAFEVAGRQAALFPRGGLGRPRGGGRRRGPGGTRRGRLPGGCAQRAGSALRSPRPAEQPVASRGALLVAGLADGQLRHAAGAGRPSMARSRARSGATAPTATPGSSAG